MTTHHSGITLFLMRFNQGQIVFIIENGMRIREAEVLRCSAGFCTIRFRNGGGTRLRESRLYATMSEAEEAKKRNSAPKEKRGVEWLG